MKRASIILLFSVFIISELRPQEFAPVGTAVAQFLEIGVGAKSTGMGEAFTTIANDASSPFWNPAGIADAGNFNLFSGYSRWPAGISIGGISMSKRLGNIGTVAVSSIYLMTGDMEITTIYEPEGTGEYFSISNYSLGITYSRYLTDRVSIGVTGKMVHEKYLDYGYTTWALDLGTIYRTGFHGLRIGMSILHFAPEIKFSGVYIDYSDPLSYQRNEPKSFESYSLPINFRFGLSMNLIETGNNRFTVATDMIHPNNNLEQYNLGVEYSLNESLFLRSGYKLTADEGGLSYGVGARLGIVGFYLIIDYSYSDMGVLRDIHRVSLSLGM